MSADDYEYEAPVSQLLTLGDVRGQRAWRDYTDLGLTKEHVPELIRMALDDDLNYADADSVEVWAPLHAWRALGRLSAVEAAEPLLELFDVLDEDMAEWNAEDLPQAYGLMGPDAIPPLRAYLADPGNGPWPRTAAARSLAEIGKQHPGARDEVIAILGAQLEHFTEQSRTLNSGLAAMLVGDLQAVEAAPVLERAYAADAVDLFVQGDWEDVQVELGLLDERQTPQPDYWERDVPGVGGAMQALRSRFEDIMQFAAQEARANLGRNDPCWCGSGKKYKHCHWRADRQR